MSALSIALADGACLVGSTGPSKEASPNLKTILRGRLSDYYARQGDEIIPLSTSLEQIQLTTATEALSVVGRVQKILIMDADDSSHTNGPSEIPLIGTRDLAELRTLLSIVFKWGIEPLLSKALSGLPPASLSARGEPRIIDLTNDYEDYKALSSFVSSVMGLLFPYSPPGSMPQTLITTMILHRHITDLLRPCIALGWLPASLASDLRPNLSDIRPPTMRLLNFLPPSQTISSLGTILSSASTHPPYIRKMCSTLLSQQLLRPQGVHGLCAAVFGEGEISADDAPLEQLEHVAHVLTSVPSRMKPEEYFDIIVPKVIDLLGPGVSPAYIRSASFSVSRMLDDSFIHQGVASKMLFSILHNPFRDATQPSPDLSPPLLKLIILISNTDPSPTLISALLTPIASTLYSLYHHMDKNKTSDPSLRESLYGLLVTWGKIANTIEGVNILWSILESEEEHWEVDLEGHIHKSKQPDNPPSLSLLTPKDLQDIDGDGSFSPEHNILDLYPDPVRFVRFLKKIDRTDISSEIFVHMLEVYSVHKAQEEDNPTRVLLYLQVIMQMQTHLSNGRSSSNILCEPIHLLAFIKHVLEPSSSVSSLTHKEKGADEVRLWGGLGLGVDTTFADEADSDDDTPGSEIISADDDMIETSVNLLLSVLEANEDISARTTPLLHDIFSLLEPLTRLGSPSVRPLAREARLVMTARLASTSTSGKLSQNPTEESPEDVYQKALKLLQDPILPVRAHGLLLLRQLVSHAPGRDSKPRLSNHALVPAVLSIFLQSIHDDDSYIFLNAVQGLAAMVDTFGKDVLKGLINEYVKGLQSLGPVSLTNQDIDSRVRIGEALGLAIRRCGDALGLYLDILVPPLFKILTLRDVPTTMRTSSLSLLAECESTDPLSMLPYVEDLTSTMVDLLQIETVAINPEPPAAGEGLNEHQDSVDSQPTSSNSQLPSLRRAALHFLSLLFRETTRQVYDSAFGVSLLHNGLIQRARITLSYVASTDQDTVVRVMAREAKESLDQFQRAVVGM